MTFTTAVPILFTSFVYCTNVYWSVIHGMKKTHSSLVWNWYHWFAIAILHQPRPADSADTNTRLQLSDTSSIPLMHGGFLLALCFIEVSSWYIEAHIFIWYDIEVEKVKTITMEKCYWFSCKKHTCLLMLYIGKCWTSRHPLGYCFYSTYISWHFVNQYFLIKVVSLIPGEFNAVYCNVWHFWSIFPLWIEQIG